MEAIVDKIKKLMRLAENQQGLPEGELAAQMAAKLQVEHAVEVSLDDDNQSESFEDRKVSLKGATTWRRSLFNVCALHCACRAIYYPGTAKMLIFGRAVDIEIALYLYESCHSQLTREADDYMVEWRFDNEYMRDYSTNRIPGDKRTRNGFLRSAISGLNGKLEGIRKQVHKAADATQIMVVRSHQTKEAFEAAHKTGKGRNTRYQYNQAGYTAGRNLNVNPGLGGGNKGKLR